jgi:hypothetical protein
MRRAHWRIDQARLEQVPITADDRRDSRGTSDRNEIVVHRIPRCRGWQIDTRRLRRVAFHPLRKPREPWSCRTSTELRPHQDEARFGQQRWAHDHLARSPIHA